MKLLYKPFALIFSVIAARMGKGVYKSLWARIDRDQPPKPTTERATFAKAVGAATLEAATMAGASAAADRASAKVFHYMTGYWPTPKEEKKAEKEEKKAEKKDKKEKKES
jgi:hypothetical protein